MTVLQRSFTEWDGAGGVYNRLWDLINGAKELGLPFISISYIRALLDYGPGWTTYNVELSDGDG